MTPRARAHAEIPSRRTRAANCWRDSSIRRSAARSRLTSTDRSHPAEQGKSEDLNGVVRAVAEMTGCPILFRATAIYRSSGGNSDHPLGQAQPIEARSLGVDHGSRGHEKC